MADIVTSQIFTDGERGITATKMNAIISGSAIQPAFYTSKPTAGTADPTDIALILKSGAYAQVPISTLGGSATQAQIWSTRLRSFNSLGNPNFEVTQRNCGAGLATANGAMIEDRWLFNKVGTASCTNTSGPSGPGLVIPGTSYRISSRYLSSVLTTAQASLGTGDSLQISQYVEGPQLRELIGDVHSISLLVYTSVAGLKFSVYLRDSPPTQSLVKLCTIPAANTWTLITLPNIPVFPSGNFSINPGVVGYQFGICLAAGTTLTAPAADTWQAGNFIGAPSMSNFAASPVNSLFYCAFVQHEPGAVCSTLMDKPFAQNYDECLRYYQKTYPYSTVAGTIGIIGGRSLISLPAGTSAAYGPSSFYKPMAKVPTVTLYNHNTGAAGSVQDSYGVNHASATVGSPGDSGFYTISFTTAPSGIGAVYFHYTADTGW